MRGTRRHRAGALLRRLCASLLALAATAVSVPAGADELIGNHHTTANGQVVLGSSNDAAQSFTTGAYPQTGITLTSIDVRLKTGAGTTAPTMTLRTGSAAGTAVATLTASDTFNPNGFPILAFTPSTTTKLAATTTYWAVLEGGSDDLGWRYTNSDHDNVHVGGSSVANTGETRSASSTGSYTARTNGAFILRVEAEPDLPQPPDSGRVLVHNLDEKATSDAVDLDSTNRIAQVFRTGGAAGTRYTLDSIELCIQDAISSTDIGDLSASVWSVTTSGNPDAKQYDLGKPAAIEVMEISNGEVVVGPVARFTAPANKVLDGNSTPYAIVLSYDSTVEPFTTKLDTETSSAGFTLDDTLRTSTKSGTTWSAHADNSLLMRVNGAVDAVNIPPTVANAIPDQAAPVGTAFSYAFPDTTFTDANSDMLTYMAMKADGNPLPMWLTFAATTRTFSGMPAAADVGTTVAVKVTASDGNGGSVSDEFNIVVVAAHCNPSNTNELWCATLTVGTVNDMGTTYYGYASGSDAYGGLAPSTFTYRMVTIDVVFFEYDAGNLFVEFERRVGSPGMTPLDGVLGAGSYTLEIGAGGDKKSFVNSNPGTSTTFNFTNPGLSWSSGDTVPIKLVRAPNTAPTSADSTVTATEDTDYAFLAARFPFIDMDAGAELDNVKIVTLPATGKGTLTLLDTALTSADLPQTVGAFALDFISLKYVPPANEYGDDLTSFTFKVNDGAVDSATHTMTINVTGVDEAATGKPEITGTAQVGQTLTATVGTIADPDGLPDPFLTDADTSFQWIQVATDNTETDISGATASTYTLLAGELGKTIKVKVTFTDDGNTAETLTSEATATVAAGTDTTPPTVMWIVRQDPASTPTNADTLIWRVTFSEPVMGVDAADFTVAGTTATATLVSPVTGMTTVAYDVTASGGNLNNRNDTVTLSFVTAHGIVDAASNALTDTAPTGANEVSYVLDNTAPTVDSIERQTPASSPTNADTLIWRVTFSEPMTGVDATDFTVAGTTATAMTASAVVGMANAYDISVSGGDLASLNATATLSFVTAHGIVDTASNALSDTAPTGASEVTYVLDNTPPTPAAAEFTARAGNPVNALRFSETLKWTNLPAPEDITVTADGIAVEITAISSSTLNRTVVTLDLSPLIRQGQVVVLTYTDPTPGDDANAFQDAVGNDAASFTTGQDGVPPVTNSNDLAPVAPGAPTILTATPDGTSTNNLAWTAPADNGGRVISGYKIESSSDGGMNWTDLVANTMSTDTIYEHTGLTGGGTLQYRVSAINSIGTSAVSNVATVNNPPTVVNIIPDQEAATATAFNYAFPATTFTDADSDALTYKATKADGMALPRWLTFTDSTRAFSGTPAAADVGTLSVKVTASDGIIGGSVSDEFNIVVVRDPNAGICPRTEAVRDAILDEIAGVSDCVDVTATHLAAIAGKLDLRESEITALAVGDFAGLTALTELLLDGNDLTALPAGVFDELTALETLQLRENGLATLPAGVFDELTALTELGLANNALATLPAGVFDALTALTVLLLADNALATLPAGVFDELTALTELVLTNNGLATLPAGVFDALTALTELVLADNALATLPAGVFDALTALTELYLDGNPGAPFAPTVVALPDDGKVSLGGDTVMLDGRGSGGAWGENVTYSWALTTPTNGVTVTFNDAASTTPRVTIPALTAGTELVFTLTVTGRGGSDSNRGLATATDTATVTVNNFAATGAPQVSAPNVFRVPALLTAHLDDITDGDGKTMIGASVTYNWQRFAANGTTLEMDAIGTGSTYTLTAADAGKRIKVAVSFTDDAGTSEGPLTSVAYPTTGTVTAAGACNAPTFSGGATQVWTGKVGVAPLIFGSFENTLYGFSNGRVTILDIAAVAAGGSLSNPTLSLGTAYTVSSGAVGANPGRIGPDLSERLVFATTTALAAAERAQLTLYVCDQPFLFSAATLANDAHEWTMTGLDWTGHAERTLTISRDQAAPTFGSARLAGTTLTITFSEDLAAAASLINSAFMVKKTPSGGVEADVTLSGTPTISGRKVTLTLSSALVATDTVTVGYTKPDTGTDNKLVDKFGNEVADFEDGAVELVLETDPPVISDTALAADGLTLTLTYNEALEVTSPAATAFPVKATPAGGSEGPLTVDTVSVSGSTVVLTLAAPAAHDDAVTVAYTKPGSGDVVEDVSGNEAAPFSARAVTNNSAVPRVTIEALHTDATPGIANPEFRVIRSNTAATALDVNLTVTQAADYLDETTQIFTIAANATTAEMTFKSTLFDSNVSGDLILTVAGGADHLPGVTGNAATVAMKLPAAGSIAAVEYGQTQGGWVVIEGEPLDVLVTVTLAANVARPRTNDLVYALATEADTATINVDYTHTAENLSFPAASWIGTGTGANPYAQTVRFRVPTLQDTDYEGEERFSVTIASSSALPFPLNSVPVKLLDDETLMLTGISLTSTPAMGAYYRAGETITVTAAFTGNVTVDSTGGTPQFGLDLGAAGSTALRQAAYASGTGTQALVFSYTVAAGDDDPDGVSWAENSLGLNGGAIHFTSTDPAARVAALITHGAGAPAAAHKVDAATPVFASAAVNGTALTITFNEDLAPAADLANSAFMVKKTPSGGAEADVALSGTPSISGNTVSLTLAAAVTATDRSVKVKYTKPSSGSSNALVDARGNAVVTFTQFEPVFNVLGDTTPPVLDSAEVDGETLTLTYNEALDTGSEPAPGDFSVSVARQTAVVSDVALSGSALTLTLAVTVLNTDTVTVTYTAGSNPIQDLAGNDAADIPIPGRAVDNVTVSPPGAPGSLTAIPGNEQVGLGWAPPSVTGGAAIVRYEYRVSLDGGNNWLPDWTAVPDGPDTGSDAADERAYVVTGLTNGTAYTFEVRASNSTHSGPAAQAEATPQTGPAADPGAPSGFAARAGDAAVTLSWRAPLDTGNRPLLRYEVRYAEGSTLSASVSWQDAGAVLTYTVAGLTNGRQHTFEVRAVNTADRAGAAARAQATPEVNADVPGPVRSLRAAARNFEVVLYWHTPAREGLTAITHYEFRYARGSSVPTGAAWVRVHDTAGNGRTVDGLENGIAYTFEVRAVNATGAGALAQVRATPGEPALRAPGAPGNLRAVSGVPYVDGSIEGKRAYVDVTLSWDAPADDGDDPIFRYETRYRAGSAAWTAYRHVEYLSEPETTVAHLTPGARYTFELRAVNEVGPGTAASRQLTTARYTGPTVTLQAGGSAREGEPFTLRATRSGSTTADTYVFFELYDSAYPNGYQDGTPYHHVVAYFNGTTATASYTPPFDGTRAGRTFTVRISSVNQLYAISGGLVTVSVADRDAGLSVADASVREGTGATLEFVVRLDRARAGAVTVDYATSAGSATAGLDYTEVSGTLSIPAGSRRASIEVPVLDDDIDDDRETLTLTLSNADGAIIDDGVATGTIRNTDALPKAWLSRFGRSAAVQVVTLLDERFEAAAASDTRLVLGGRAVDVAALRTATAGEPAGRERSAAGCSAEAGTGAPQECDTAERARLPGAAGAAPGRPPERIVRLDDQAGTFGQPGTDPGRPAERAVRLDEQAGLFGQPGADPVRPAERIVRLDDQAGTFGQPGVDMTAVPGEQADPAEQAGQAGEATLLERALWTLLTQRGRLQFDKRQFISQSSFDLSWAHLDGAGVSPDPADSCAECAVMQAQDFSGRWSLWGRGALMQFSGQDNAVNVRGDVLTGLLGVDYARARWLAGAALAYHDGNGSYSSSRDAGTGALDSVLVTVNPYLRYALTERLSVWGTLGYGAGALTLRQSGGADTGGQDADAVIETDLRMGMGALGLRGVVYAGEHTEWALKSDALWVRTSSAETAGMRSAGADTSRLRLLLSGQHQRALANDALLSPGVELGLRYDDGDAETGLGLELGAGLRYADSVRGLIVETKVRALLAHEDGAYEEWGLSGSLSLDPGRLGRGLALRLDSGWGVADSGAEALWQRQTTAGIAPQHDSAAQQRITAEMGYGLDVPWTAAILTPYSGVEWAGSGRTLRLGWRFVLGQRLSLSLDGERTETGHTPPEHALMLRTSLPW